jgi:pyruvate dehydrogenase E1 component alpha subunit
MKEVTQEVYLKWYEHAALESLNKLAALYIQQSQRILHLYNGNSTCRCVTCNGLDKDKMITAYRNHVQPIGMGVDPNVMAELLGKLPDFKRNGWFYAYFLKEHRFYGGHGIVGGQIPLGAVSFADKYFETGGVTLTYFGDGAAHKVPYEALTWLYVNYQLFLSLKITVTQWELLWKEQQTHGYMETGLGYEMPCGPVDGMNPVKVAEAMTRSYRKSKTWRRTNIPRNETTVTEDTQCLMLNYTVLKTKWKNIKIDPITQVLDLIKDQNMLPKKKLQQLKKSKSFSPRMCDFAEESDYPPVQQLYDVVYEQKTIHSYLINYKNIMAIKVTMPRL